MRKSQIVRHLTEADPQGISRRANRVRRHFVGDEVHLRTLLGISTYCRRDCQYCAMRRSNHLLPRYRLTWAEIVERCREATEAGVRSITLETGEDPELSGPEIAEIILAIKAVDPSVAVTLDLGEHPEREYRRWRESTADRYNLNFDTSNPKLYRKLRTGMPGTDRSRAIRTLQKVGYQVGTGFLVGLPEQTPDDLADDLLTVRRLDADIVDVRPFVPVPNTPLADSPPAPVDLTLRVLALSRIIMKQVHMSAPIGLGEIDPEAQTTTLLCGANTVTMDITPATHAAHYQVYSGRKPDARPIAVRVADMQRRMKALGRRLSSSRGDAFSFKNKRSARKRLLPADLVTVKDVTPSQWLSDQRRKANWS
jgi:biotin synthase